MRRKSWAVRLSNDGSMSSYAGSSVEMGADFLAEGVWDDDFTSEGILRASFRCGSGLVIREDHVIAFAPSHSLAQIYLVQGEKDVLIGNSLHLLIALCPNARFQGSISNIWSAAQGLIKGTLDYPRKLYGVEGYEVHRFAFGGAVIDRRDLTFSEIKIGTTPNFFGYEQYKHLLDRTIDMLAACGRDQRRKHKYTDIVTTVSSGYDSAVCSVLAKAAGARKALTVSTGRGGVSDSGKEVADALGLECYEYERFCTGHEKKIENSNLDWLSTSLVGEEHWEFLASINSPGDMFFSSFELHLSDTLVLTGFHGDKAWNMSCSSGQLIERGDYSGTGLDEFSSRVDFVNVPVPFIGVSQWSELARINRSAEMKPYSVETSYNRPICRRIVEDAGVPRSAFGMKKSASEILLAWNDAEPLRTAAFERLVGEYEAALEVYALTGELSTSSVSPRS